MRCPSVVALVLAVAAASPARAEWTLVWADEGNTVKYDLGSAATNALFHSNTPSHDCAPPRSFVIVCSLV